MFHSWDNVSILTGAGGEIQVWCSCGCEYSCQKLKHRLSFGMADMVVG